MKHLLTAVFLFIVSSASAQIVNIPDPAFKAELVNYSASLGPAIDANHDGEIQVSEAEAVTDLYISDNAIADLAGISSFSNLDSLHIGNPPNLRKLDIQGMTSLYCLRAYIDYLDTLNVAGCSNLRIMDLGSLSAIGTSGAGNHMRYFNISGATKLKYLDCGFVNVSLLDLRGLDSLEELAVHGQIDTFNISGLKISGFRVIMNYGPEVGTYIARNCPNLESVWASTIYNQLDVTGSSNLQYIEVPSYYAPAMDFSTNPKIDFVFTLGSPYLEYLNIKNGAYTDPSSFQLLTNMNGTPPLLNICSDDALVVNGVLVNETADWTGYYMPPLGFVSPFCSYTPGGLFNTIKGKIKLDLDNNGCDVNDNGALNIPLRITDAFNNSVITYSAFNGDYSHYEYAGNFTLQPYLAYPYFTVGPTTANIVFDTANNLIDGADFCIVPSGTHNKLDITMLPTGRTSPGFSATYIFKYRNRGTTTLSGNVQLNFDNTKMIFLAASVAPDFQAPGQLTWNYNNLIPFEDRQFLVTFSLAAPPVNNIGDTLYYLAVVNPVAGDESPNNNSFILPQKCTASYDPNDKECLQGEKLDIAKIGDDLDYIIHFQNLGTDTAFNIVVTDTLSNNLDWESFDFVGSSHTCDVQRRGNMLQFYFKDIHLPYSAIDEPASHGYVAFKIKPRSTVVIGDSLNNSASIYFDFNLPVVTNMATTIVSPASNVAVKLEYFSLTSRNETNLLTWKAPATSGLTHFGIERSNDGIHFSNLGNITANVDRCQWPFNFADENPFDGKTYYRLNIKDADGNSFYSKVLLAKRTRSGLSVTTIVSDKNNTSIYLNASKQQNVQIKIIAMDGRLLYNQTKTIAAGNSTLNLPLKDLGTGIYTLVVYTEDGEIVTKRFIK